MVPACYKTANQLSVTADTVSVPVIANTDVYDYCRFTFTGATTVSIRGEKDIKSFSISPKSLNLSAVVKGKSLAFTISKPCYLIIKLADCRELVLCAEAPEINPPASNGKGIFNITSPAYNADTNGVRLCSIAIQKAINDAHAAGGGIVYVPAGVFKCANLMLRSHVSLYLAAAAVLIASENPADHVTRYLKNSLRMDGTWLIYTENASSDIRIYGRGTIDGNARVLRGVHHYLDNLVVPLQCNGFTLEGVTLRDSGLWGLIPTRCQNVEIRDTKHFNENDKFYEDDAMDIMESQNVNVKHTIAISEDDTYSTKTWGPNTDIAVQWPGSPEVLSDVVFDDAVAWSRCATYKVGFGVYQAQKNITFKNACSYRSMRAIALNHNMGTQPAENIVFENIDIEGFWPRNNSSSRWLEVTTRSASGVTNILVKNITVRALGSAPSVIKGFSDQAKISGIAFNQISVMGKAARSLSDLQVGETNQFVSGISFFSKP